jgi:hypothetical protein
MTRLPVSSDIDSETAPAAIGLTSMRLPRRTRAGLGRLFAVLAMLAFALRAATPAGFMLAATERGALTVTLCSGHGPETITVDAQSGAPQDKAPTKNGEDAKAQAPCVFAAAAALAAPVEPPSLAAPLAIAAAPETRVATARPGEGLAAPPPPATGPPILS